MNPSRGIENRIYKSPLTDELSAQKKLPTNQFTISIFDQVVCIRTDVTDYLELIRKTYSHFLVDQPGTNGQALINVSFFVAQDCQSGQPRLIINGEKKQFDEPRLMQSEYIHSIILNSIYSQVCSHYLHHAAALSFNDKGIIIAADSGSGKTTLTLALVQHGFRFLSDEIAALGRSDGRIYPFPRGLHIREESLNLLDLSVPREKVSYWFGKYLVDIDDIFPGMIGEPAIISRVFILKNKRNPELDPSNSCEFKAVVSHTNRAFFDKVNDHPEITEFQVSEEQGNPCLTIKSPHRIKAITFLEDLCCQQGIVILDLIKRIDKIPDFLPVFNCERIPRSEAALELLRHFVGGHRSALLNSENNQDSARLLFELAMLLRNADCYQITRGPLEEMVDTIANLVSKASHSTGMKVQ